MKMKHVVALVSLFCSAGVQAEDFQYLYWQVDLTANPYSVPAFSYATVSDDGGASHLSFYDTKGVAVSDEMLADAWSQTGDTGTKAGPLYSGFDASVTSGSFLFELWREDAVGAASRVGWASYSYEQLLAGNYIYQAVVEGGGTALTIAVVPEPSSALLFLLGMAGLALKRRKT